MDFTVKWEMTSNEPVQSDGVHVHTLKEGGRVQKRGTGPQEVQEGR